MLSLTQDRETFAARRRAAQTRLEEVLTAAVKEALDTGKWDVVVEEAEELFRSEYKDETGSTFRRSLRTWGNRLEDTLAKGQYTGVHSVNDTALWVATYILSTVSMQAAKDDDGEVFLEWVTMHDGAVRASHKSTDGQVRPVGEKFDVDGAAMEGPGDVTAPVAEWIRCRCTLRPTLAAEFSLTASGGTMEPTPRIGGGEPIPWYGVWAVEGEWTGDGRRFKQGSLSTRELPLPFTWQKKSDDGHKGNITIGHATDYQMAAGGEDLGGGKVANGGEMLTSGVFFESVPETDEAIGLLAEAGRFGVSVDADDTEMELVEGGDREGVEFSRARVASACMLPIPAFAQAWVQLGQPPWMKDKKKPTDDVPDEAKVPEEDMVRPDAPTDENGAPIPPEDRQAPDAPVDPEADPKDPKKKKPYPVAASGDSLPIVSQEEVDAADNPMMHGFLENIRKQQQEADPSLAADLAASLTAMRQRVEQFVDVAPGRTEDGPGWITNPVDTDRLRDYWVRGAGAAKIGWGAPGDFNRCRALVAEYVKPQHINGYCANRHYDALGFWPGRAPSEQSGQVEEMAPLHLVAAGGFCAPAEWFDNPGFAEGDGRVVPTKDGLLGCPFTITKEGRVFGHIALWGTCHLDSELTGGQCVTPPHSETDYSQFLNGSVLTDNGYVPTGPISVGSGHAAGRLGVRGALAHYDNAATAAADVTCGEDGFGIWVAGWVRPGTPDSMVAAMLASPPSGDWREYRGNLEMIAVLSVNSPGFAVPRPRVAASNGRQVSLVAAGIVVPEEDTEPALTIDPSPQVSTTAPEEWAQRVAVELAAIEERKAALAALAETVNALQEVTPSGV